MLKGMLHKDPEKRLQLIDVMNLEYFMMDNEDLQKIVVKAEKDLGLAKLKEEEKAEKKWEEGILSGLHISQSTTTPTTSGSTSGGGGSTTKSK
jgi:hypothetical protein